jgi:hypothetical protein
MELGHKLFQFFVVDLGSLSWVFLDRKAHIFFSRTGSRRNIDVEIIWALVAESRAPPGPTGNSPMDGKFNLRRCPAVDCPGSLTTEWPCERVDRVRRRL